MNNLLNSTLASTKKNTPPEIHVKIEYEKSSLLNSISIFNLHLFVKFIGLFEKAVHV